MRVEWCLPETVSIELGEGWGGERLIIRCKVKLAVSGSDVVLCDRRTAVNSNVLYTTKARKKGRFYFQNEEKINEDI